MICRGRYKKHTMENDGKYSSFTTNKWQPLMTTIGWFTDICGSGPVGAVVNSSPPDKMAAISQTTFSNAFSWMKSFVFWFEFHWSLFLRVQLIISRHWFRKWLGAEQATSHYLKQCWTSTLTHICGTLGEMSESFASGRCKSYNFQTHHTGYQIANSLWNCS